MSNREKRVQLFIREKAKDLPVGPLRILKIGRGPTGRSGFSDKTKWLAAT
jgi:hypothetical protein